MAATPALDLDLLRTLIAIAEEGGFTRAGERVGRTQSAVSLQLQRLEAVVGRTLVARGKGGSIELTAHGTALVERGRALLAPGPFAEPSANDGSLRKPDSSHRLRRRRNSNGFGRLVFCR
jgi:molybdenum-dependent DNA-binding transcriptional regulator ModE